MLPFGICRRNINEMWGYSWGRTMWLWICGVMANTSVSNTEALGSTPCKSVLLPFRQVDTAGGFDPLIRRFKSCKGSLY